MKSGSPRVLWPTDDLISSDSFTFSLSGQTATLTETLLVSEALTSIFNPLATLTDNPASSDQFFPAAVLSWVYTLADSVASSDVLAGIAVGQSLADIALVADLLTSGTGAWVGSLTDTAASSSTQSAVNVLSLTDSTASSDAFTLTAQAAALTLNDTVVVSDGNLGGGAASFTLTDTTASSDVVTFNASLSLSDSVTSSDTVTQTGRIVTLTDSAVSGDVLGGVLNNALIALADSAASSDSLLASGFGLAISSAAVSADILSVTGYGLALSDSTSSSDATTGLATAAATLADSAASSSAIQLAGLAVVLGDSLATADVLGPAATLLAPLSDIVVSGEVLFTQQNAPNSLADSITSSDALPFVKGFVIAAPVDTAASSDSVTLTGYGYWYRLQDIAASSGSVSLDAVNYPPSLTAMVIPTGGAVLLQLPSSFVTVPNPQSLTIRRSVQGSGVWTVIYQGAPVGVFLDVGDGMAAPLDAATSYLWQVTDSGGTATVGPLIPASSLINTPDQLTQILIRALQGAVNSMTLPPGVQRPLITIKMPTNGWQAMPFIVVNVDLIQQTEVEIGEDVVNPTADNNWTLFANAKRVWRVTIMSQDVDERDFYRDSLLAVFRVLKATAFGPIGLDVSHTIQATSYSSAQEWDGVAPGFYGADLMLEIDGVFPAAVLTSYPVIQQITSTPTWLLNTFTETFT